MHVAIWLDVAKRIIVYGSSSWEAMILMTDDLLPLKIVLTYIISKCDSGSRDIVCARLGLSLSPHVLVRLLYVCCLSVRLFVCLSDCDFVCLFGCTIFCLVVYLFVG